MDFSSRLKRRFISTGSDTTLKPDDNEQCFRFEWIFNILSTLRHISQTSTLHCKTVPRTLTQIQTHTKHMIFFYIRSHLLLFLLLLPAKSSMQQLFHPWSNNNWERERERKKNDFLRVQNAPTINQNNVEFWNVYVNTEQ